MCQLLSLIPPGSEDSEDAVNALTDEGLCGAAASFRTRIEGTIAAVVADEQPQPRPEDLDLDDWTNYMADGVADFLTADARGGKFP